MKRITSFIYNNSFDLSLKNIVSKPEFGHSIWIVTGQVLVSITAFGMTYALANYVTEAVAGMFRFVLALYAAISAFALVGMNNALMNAVAAGNSGSYKFAVYKKIQYGLIGSLILGATALHYAFNVGDVRLAQALVIVSLLLPWIEAFSLSGPYLSGASRFKHSSIFLTIERIVTSGAVVLVSLVQPSVLAISTAYFVLRFLVAFLLYFKSKKIVPPNNLVDESILTYAKHLTGMSLFGVLTAQLDKFILFFFFGPISLATFWIASVLPQEVGRFSSVILGSFFPRLVKSNSELSFKFVQKSFILLSVIGITGSIAYMFIAQYIFALFLPLYDNAVSMSVVLMLAYAVNPYTIVWNYLTAKKKINELYIFNIGEPVLLLLAYALFVPWLGVWGLVLALCFRTFCLNLLSVYYLFIKKNDYVS